MSSTMSHTGKLPSSLSSSGDAGGGVAGGGMAGGVWFGKPVLVCVIVGVGGSCGGGEM